MPVPLTNNVVGYAVMLYISFKWPKKIQRITSKNQQHLILRLTLGVFSQNLIQTTH